MNTFFKFKQKEEQVTQKVARKAPNGISTLWEKEEEELITSNAGKLSIDELCALFPDRSRMAVIKKMYKMKCGVRKNKYKDTWSNSENRVITKNINSSLDELCTLLPKRTRSQIQQKLYYLKGRASNYKSIPSIKVKFQQIFENKTVDASTIISILKERKSTLTEIESKSVELSKLNDKMNRIEKALIALNIEL